MSRDSEPTPSHWGLSEVDGNQELTSLAEACQALVGSGQVGDIPRAVDEVYRAWQRLSQDLEISDREASGERLLRWMHAIARAAGINGDQLSETIRLGLVAAQPWTMADIRQRLSTALPAESASCDAYLSTITAIMRRELASPAGCCALSGIGSWSRVTWKPRTESGLPARPWIHFTAERSLKQALNAQLPLALPSGEDGIIRSLIAAGYPPARALALSAALALTVFALLSEPRKALVLDGVGTLVRLDHGIRSGENPKTLMQVVIPPRTSVGFLPVSSLIT